MTKEEYNSLKSGDLVTAINGGYDIKEGRTYRLHSDCFDSLYFIDDNGWNRSICDWWRGFSVGKICKPDFRNLPIGTTEIVVNGIRYKSVTKITTEWEIV